MPEIGDIVEGYRIDALIGRGGMGAVYEATQLSLSRTVALKVITGELSKEPAFRERFRREGLLQASLEHPHIVTVYEAGESEHGLFLAMRLIRGPNLKDLIVARQLDVSRTLRILAQAGDALDAAHEAGLIHRDIKPHNILVAVGRDHAYLADFGVTKAPGDRSLTRTGAARRHARLHLAGADPRRTGRRARATSTPSRASSTSASPASFPTRRTRTPPSCTHTWRSRRHR